MGRKHRTNRTNRTAPTSPTSPTNRTNSSSPKTASLPDGVAAAFVQEGCRRLSRHRFAVDGCELQVVTLGGLWLRLESSSFTPDWPMVGSDSFMDESLLPTAPVKVVPGERLGTVRVLADLPLETAATSEGTHGHDPLPESFISDQEGLLDQQGDEIDSVSDIVRCLPSGGEDDRKLWAADVIRGLRTLADAKYAEPSRPNERSPAGTSVQKIAERLKRRSWICSTSGDTVRVNMEGRHHFNQVELHPNAADGARVDMELTDTQGWDRTSLGAAVELCRRANERLRFVRLVLRRGGERRPILAQVHLGRLVESWWLDLALDALRVTAVFLSEELPALGAEPSLATWILASAAAARRRGQVKEVES